MSRSFSARKRRTSARSAASSAPLSNLNAAIEHRVRIPDLQLPSYPIAPGAGRDEIEDVAQAIRGGWALPDEPIPHVVREIERRGVPVARATLGSRQVDAFAVRFSRRGRSTGSQ